MRLLLAFLLVNFTNIGSLDRPKVEDVRISFHKASSSEKECRALIDLLQPYHEMNSPLLFGYKAGATMLMAKHLFNPFSKLSYFKKGVKMLEKAIHHDQKNIELRFLRYTIQTNVPSFLNYSKDKDMDRAFLLSSINTLKDPELKKIINAYLSKK